MDNIWSQQMPQLIINTGYIAVVGGQVLLTEVKESN